MSVLLLALVPRGLAAVQTAAAHRRPATPSRPRSYRGQVISHIAVESVPCALPWVPRPPVPLGAPSMDDSFSQGMSSTYLRWLRE